MSRLQDSLERRKRHFEKGGRFEQYAPLFDALSAVLYTSGETTRRAPHVRDAMDLTRIMMLVLYALIPCVFMALYNTGFQANLALNELGVTTVSGWRGGLLSALGIAPKESSILANLVHGALYFFPVYLLCVAVGTFWEGLFAVLRRRPMNEMSLVTTLLFALLMPPSIPWWQVALGMSFGVVIGKEVFGGVGMNIVNPSLVGYAFLFFAYPAQISGDAVWVAVDGVSRATPLAELADSTLRMTVSWHDAFLGFIPGSMGETSTLACLVGAAVLLISGVASWRIMLGTVAGMAGIAVLLNLIGSDTNPMFHVTPLWHLVLGGFAFGWVFMATDPVTAATTETGQLIYGGMIGILVVLIRVLNPAYTEGVMLAILFGNVFAPVIDKLVINRSIRNRRLHNAS